MITSAPWLAWPGFEAFFVTCQTGGPCYLIRVDRRELASRLRKETLEQIITGEKQ